jgi:hypothetical protein
MEINIRVTRYISPTTLCVGGEGQKTYFTKSIGSKGHFVGYSSGAQIKRYIIDTAINRMPNPLEEKGPYTFGYKLSGEKTEEDVVYKPCNPMYAEDLLGGWMKTESSDDKKTKKTKKEKKQSEPAEESEDVDKKTIARRSPGSISALTSLHELLAGTFTDSVVVNKEDRKNIFIIEGKTPEEVESIKNVNTRIRPFHYKKNSTIRMHGIYCFDVVINLDRLFVIEYSEVQPDILKKLSESSQWKLNDKEKTITLIDKKRRSDIIKALAYGIIYWQPLTNQSSAYSNSPVLSVAVTDNASEIVPSVLPIMGDGFIEKLEFNIPKNGKLFIAPTMASHQSKVEVDKDALANAEKYIIEQLER